MLMFKTPLVNIPNLSIILMFKKKPLVNIPERDSIGYLMVYRLIITLFFLYSCKSLASCILYLPSYILPFKFAFI